MSSIVSVSPEALHRLDLIAFVEVFRAPRRTRRSSLASVGCRRSTAPGSKSFRERWLPTRVIAPVFAVTCANAEDVCCSSKNSALHSGDAAAEEADHASA